LALYPAYGQPYTREAAVNIYHTLSDLYFVIEDLFFARVHLDHQLGMREVVSSTDWL
jgi:hypothetical protein